MNHVRRSFALCGLAALAAAAPVPAGDEPVDVTATVIGVREAPAGSTLPGIHLEVKINGRTSDVYLAPADFLAEFGMTFQAGDDVHIVGLRTKAGGIDVVLAHEISVGASERRTLYLRDDHGPFRAEASGSGINTH